MTIEWIIPKGSGYLWARLQNLPAGQVTYLTSEEMRQVREMHRLDNGHYQLPGMHTMTDMPETGAVDINPPTDHVQNHIDLVIDDLVSGRTTTEQRRGLKSATERADRVAPASDAAVGRAVR